MDFKDISSLFNRVVTYTLDIEENITEVHVTNLSNLFEKFSNINLKEDYEISLFLNCVVKYFVFLSNYGQTKELSPLEQFTVRAALGKFLFVVEKAELHEKIMLKLRKIIDALVDTKSVSQIKEFLRVYSCLLDKVSPEVMRKLATKHKTFPNLCRIVKDVSDIETQAVIIEVILKFLRHGCLISIDEDFLQTLKGVASDYKSDMYQNIRMILDQLNEFSSNIFSINCTKIEIDSSSVIEFEGASNTHDIWLDINLLQSQISFFCCQKYAFSVEDIKLYTSSSTWEVLSFSAHDVVEKFFKYDSLTHVLNVSLLLNASNMSLFATSKCDKLRNISICVSKSSGRFQTFVEVVLPQLFGNTFSAVSLNISPQQQESDTDLSSPIIDHFVQRKKVSSAKEESNDYAKPATDAFIIISDEENDSILTHSKDNEEKQHISCITLSDAESELYRKDDLVILRKKSKICVRSNGRSNLNKSSSPLSFNDSVVGRKSQLNLKRSKISKIKSYDSEKPSMKISRFAERKEPDTNNQISSELNIFEQETVIVNDSFDKEIPQCDLNRSTTIEKGAVELFELPEVESRNHEATKQNVTASLSTNLPKEIEQFEVPETVLNFSTSKVMEWLEHRLEPETPRFVELLKQDQEVQMIQEESPVVSPSIGAHNTDPKMFVEERIELLMNGSEKNEEGSKNSEAIVKNDEPINTVDGLLKILCSQETVKENENKPKEAKKTDVVDKIVSPTKIPSTAAKKKEINDYDKIYTLSEYNAITSKLEKPSVKEVSPNKTAATDATPDLDLSHIATALDKSVKKKETPRSTKVEVERKLETSEVIEKKAQTKLPVKQGSNIKNTSQVINKPSKRKLYNPDDLSHLNNTFLLDFDNSVKEKYEASPLKPNIIQIYSGSANATKKIKKSYTKRKSTPKKEIPKKLNKDNFIKRNSQKKIEITKIEKKKKRGSKTFDDIYNELKDEIRTSRRNAKIARTLSAGKKPAISPSSSSSMEPFAIAVRKSMEKKKRAAAERSKKKGYRDASTNASLSFEIPKKREKRKPDSYKRKDQNEPMSSQDATSRKINIISNILLKPAHTHESDAEDFIKETAEMNSESYLNYIKRVYVRNPKFLVNDNCRAIMDILESCLQQQ